MDISVSYPAHGRIEFRSQFLFSDAQHDSCRGFVERVLLAKEVTSITVETSKRRAEICYCTETISSAQAIQIIHACLSNGHKNGNGHANGNGNGHTNGNGHHDASEHHNGNGTNGHGTTVQQGDVATQVAGDRNGATANGHAKKQNGRATNGKPAQRPLALHPDSRGVVRVFRHGEIVSNWEVVREIPGRMRLKNGALHRRKEICEAIERELMSVLGVQNYKTNPLTSSVLVLYNEHQIRRDQIIEILDSALEHASPGDKDKHDLEFALCTLSIPLAATAQFAVPALLPVSAALFIYTSIPTFKEAYEVLFKERRLGVDVLDTIVVGACLGTGSLFAGSMLCWCLSFGRLLVKKTQDNSKKMLLNVFGKQSRFVWLCRDGVEVETPLEKIEQGDIIVVNTGEGVPVDGVIVEGLAMVDQHALTGESQPAEKSVGDKVFASTMLIAGKIFVEVEQAGTETASAKIAAILNDSAGYKLSSQHRGEVMADRAVIPTLALGTLGLATMGPAGATAVLNSDFGTGIRMAAPLGMLSSLALCAQHGILVKDGRALELMSGIDTVLFDKTGTLTREVPEVGEVISCGRYEPDQILTYAAAAENKMSHPIARAILDKFYELGRPLPATDDSKYNIGFGITVVVEGKTIRVGSARFMDLEGIPIPASVKQTLDRAHEEGHSLVMVGVDNELGGALELQASRRPEVEGIIQGLRKRGIKHLAIISGDHEGPTRKLAHSLGMDEYFAGVLPADKANYVEKLQKEGKKVCFVGDGINDSIALKKANVSVSLRGATSIATDTAQIVFMEESLAKLCDLVDIAHGLDHNVKRSWYLILAPNALCIAGAFTMGFGIMASVLTNNVAAIAALINGIAPLRTVAKLQAQAEHLQELRMAHLQSSHTVAEQPAP